MGLKPYRCISESSVRQGRAEEIFWIEQGDPLICPFDSDADEESFVPLTTIHYLIPDPNGIFAGSMLPNRKQQHYRYACGLTSNAKYASTMREAATCFDCLEASKDQPLPEE